MITPDVRRNSRVVFLWCLAASVALHAFVFAVLPALVRDYRPHEVRVLDVVLLHPKPLSAVASTKMEMTTPAPKTVHSRPKIRESQPSQREPMLETRAPALPQLVTTEKVAKNASHSLESIAPESGLDADTKPPPAEPSPMSAPVSNVAYLHNPSPPYPLVARRNGEQGTVTLKVLVTREGTPASVAVEHTSGSRRLDEAATETVRTWRFIPARRGGHAVEAWLLVPIVFKLEGAS